jgi:hypothetical protein
MPFRIYTSLSVQAKAGLPGQLSVHLRTEATTSAICAVALCWLAYVTDMCMTTPHSTARRRALVS